MSFPFKDFAEFSASEGPIYSFAHIPWVTPVLLILSTLLFIWFMIAPFKIKH
ncbi:hypothetical protein [Phragmitibacter flavus]|uniref:hypothetical protein n=1 Tax=Phragmitibacter flavus TaxID=2576071 RepID=UPI001409B686|nr:hypothetical protein [Phragmitibacter flavus]